MINKSSMKVILAFTGMILLGLISLVFIDSLNKDGDSDATANVNLTK